MSQTSCRRCGFPVPTRWLRAGGDLSRPNPIPQSAVRPLMRSERAPKRLLHSPDLACADIEVASCWRVPLIIEIGANIKDAMSGRRTASVFLHRPIVT